MKKTPLVRKTPLKQTTGLKRSPLKQKPFDAKQSGAPSRNPTNAPAPKPKAVSKPLSRKGLAGHGRSKSHIEHHERVVNTGCFACNYLKEVPTTRLCIHHPRGRNKGKGDVCEWFVICLCYAHHDPSTMTDGDFTIPSVHGNKKLFLKLIGTETWCVHETFRLLDLCPPWLSECEWQEYLTLPEMESQTNWLVDIERKKNGYRQINTAIKVRPDRSRILANTNAAN